MEEQLLASLRKLIRKYEDGQNHDRGAYDEDCPLCRSLEELRGIAMPK